MTHWGKKLIRVLMTAILAAFLFIQPVMARSGCCSHHGGVCGCGCCDGSPLSSTCAPYYPECNGESSIQPPSTPKTEPTPTPTRKPTPTPTPKPKPFPSPTPSPASVFSPTLSPEPNLTPEVKGETSQEPEPISTPATIGTLGAMGGLGWGAYKLLKRFITKKKT